MGGWEKATEWKRAKGTAKNKVGLGWRGGVA
jgi:hypothetical protein